MRALVTGGAGFIGSTLVDRLLADGYEQVVVVDNLFSGKKANLEAAFATGKVVLHEIDVRDPGVTRVVADAKVDVVFHLAAQIDVRVSVNDPVLDADINVIGGLRVLEGARQGGTKRVVFASSGGTIYGNVADADLPAGEDLPENAVSPYGVAKSAFSAYLRAYEELHGISSVSLALANVFGPRQDPHGEAGVVAIFSQRLLRGEPCRIFGDGSATRDYVFVDDVVDAFARAATTGSGTYNIGTGTETSTTLLYETLAGAAGVAAPAEYLPPRHGELLRSCLDATRARTELGWVPADDVRSGSKKVLEYFKNKD